MTIAVLSDIHGMLLPLDSVLAEPEVARADLIVVTGDHLWGPQPTAVLDRLIALGDRAVQLRGNADREVCAMSRGHDVGLGDDPVSVWGAQELPARHRELIDALPTDLTLDVDGLGRTFFCHATPRSDEEVVLVDSSPDRWEEVLQPLAPDVDAVVCGHTHMPYLRLAAGRTIVNPGSVGLPYGRAGAHWALLSGGGITFRRTVIATDLLVAETARASRMPDVDRWLEEYVARPATDREAVEAFGPREGR